MDDKLISILAIVGHRVIFLDQAKGKYVSYSLGVILYRIGISGEVTIFWVCVTPALQWTRRYFPLVSSMIFERYFLLMNALHVDWLSRRHQFSSIPASAAAARMVLPTCIMMEFPYLTLLLIGSFYRNSCVEVWQNMRPGVGSSPHSLVGYPIMRLHEESLTFTNDFWSPPPGVMLEYLSCFIFLNASAYSLRLA